MVVEKDLIGVVVKSWGKSSKGNPPYHKVYVRNHREILDYTEDEMERYLVRHKELSEEELAWQLEASSSPTLYPEGEKK